MSSAPALRGASGADAQRRPQNPPQRILSDRPRRTGPRGRGTWMSRVKSFQTTLSSGNLHARRRRLIEELRRIAAQALRELADILGGRPALAHEAFDLRQAGARERADRGAVLRDHPV